MDAGSVLLGIVIGSVILFFWTGFSQNVLPWGVRSVQQHHDDPAVGTTLDQITPSGMVYVRNKVAAFIAIKPEAYYSMRRYFGIEFVTQLLAAAVIVGILVLSSGLADSTRLGVVALTALASVISVDLQYWNWWGFSTRYSLGVAVNRAVGYLLAAGSLLALGL